MKRSLAIIKLIPVWFALGLSITLIGGLFGHLESSYTGSDRSGSKGVSGVPFGWIIVDSGVCLSGDTFFEVQYDPYAFSVNLLVFCVVSYVVLSVNQFFNRREPGYS